MHEGWQDEVLSFWFEELTPEDWFKGGEELDARIAERFGALHARLADELDHRAIDDQRTALAAIVALDQFPRNLHRGKAEAFGTDNVAIEIARNAVDKGLDQGLNPQEKQFLYMPFMHSEISADQERCVDLFRSLGNEEALRFALDHRDVVMRFGRFPHRNRALGRETTEAERAFMEEHAGYGQ